MRRLSFSLLTFLLAASCSAPCMTSTTSSGVSCSASDAGARVLARPYSALSENFVDACEGSFDGGTLSFVVSLRSCEAGTSTGATALDCTLPTLPPGRYVVGDGALVVPADAGRAACE